MTLSLDLRRLYHTGVSLKTRVAKHDHPRSLPYLSARLVVMQVHQATGSLFNLTGIYEAARKLNAVFDVSRAASPLPAFFLIVIPLLLSIAAALAQVALAASSCDSVGNPCCRDGIGESCFPTA